MKKQNARATDSGIIRQKAEGLLNTLISPGGVPYSLTHSPIFENEAEALKLIHELEVHQIELQLLNAELVLAKEESEVTAKKYEEIYDYALSSHFTLSIEGEIIDLNTFASEMLCREHPKAIGSRFGFILSGDTLVDFNRFLDEIFASKIMQSCEVTLLTENNPPRYVELSGIIASNNKQCLLSITDITRRKKAENELIRINSELENEVEERTHELRNLNLNLASELNKNRTWQKQLKRSLNDYQRLYSYLKKVREEERHRIARIIHDGIAQLLATMKTELISAKEKPNSIDSAANETIESLLPLVEQCMGTVTSIITELRPVILERLGLVPALTKLFSDFQKQYGIPCDIRILEDISPVEGETATIIYQVLQEALTNVRIHANATYLTVRISSTSSALSIVLADNGRGITPDELTNSNSFGIIGMKERIQGLKGKIQFKGSPGKGTKVLMKVPVKQLSA